MILRIKILEKEKGENDYNMKVSAEGEPQDLTNDETTENVEIYENNENKDISISYVTTAKRWKWNDVVVDNIFAYNVATEIMQQDEDHEPKSVDECRQRNGWPK